MRCDACPSCKDTCIHARVRHMHVRIRPRIYEDTYKGTCLYARVRHMHVCMYAYMRGLYVNRRHMHVCMYACMHVCMHAHTPHMHTCIHASSTCQSNIVTFEARCAQRTHTWTHISTLEKTFALAPCRERAGDRPKQRTAHTYKDTYKDTCTGEGETQYQRTVHTYQNTYTGGGQTQAGAPGTTEES